MFSFLKKSRVYLDWAAAAPASQKAQRAFQESVHYGNPGSAHQEGRQAREVLEKARASIAKLAEVKTDAVIFTGSATEANALGILGSIDALHSKGCTYAEMHVLYDPGAHSSVVRNIELLPRRGVEITAIPYTNRKLDLEVLPALITANTVLVVLTAVCGETGAITPVREVRRVMDRVRKGILLLADASQLPYTDSFQLTRLGADMLTLDAQKIGGVRGIGALIAPRRVPLAPLYEGGGQERGLRSGTPAPALASAFAAALLEVHDDRSQFLSRAQKLRALFIQHLQILPYMEVNEGREQAPHIINLSLIGRDTDYLVALLDAAGFAVSTKSSCETDEPGSRAVLALYGDEARAVSTLRISWGPSTSALDLERFADALIASVKFLDSAGIL